MTRRARTIMAAMLVALLAGVWALVILARAEPTVGSFTTSLYGRSPSQLHNIDRAACALDGIVLQPGEEFSFNRAVGPCTAERGYLRAPAIIEGELVESPGGGVCQVSSTLYNAALLAGLEMVERSPHSYPASSVPPGRDATVVFGGPDLRFANVLPHSITIRAKSSGERLVVQITGRKKAGSGYRIVVETKDSVGPGPLYCTATVWREEMRDGGVVGREFISSDRYEFPAAIYRNTEPKAVE